MYGQSVGNLNIFLKPETQDIETILRTEKYHLWKQSGSQKNIWHEAIINMEEIQESFQIIFEGTSIGSHLGDIAIDDISLIGSEECWNEKPEQTTEESGGIFNIETCSNRCDEVFTLAIYPDIRITSGAGSGGFIKKCYCFNGCERVGLCCPDYPLTCLFNDSSVSESDVDISDSTEGKMIYTKILFKPTNELISTTKVYGKIIYETNVRKSNATEVYGKIIYEAKEPTTEGFKKFATEFEIKDGKIINKIKIDENGKIIVKKTSLLKTFLWILFIIGVVGSITYGVYFYFRFYRNKQATGYADQVRFVNDNHDSDHLLMDNQRNVNV